METTRSVFAVCEKCKEKLYLQVDLEDMKRKSKGGIFKVEVPHGGHSTIFFLTSTMKDKVQVRGQVTGDSIVGAIMASSHQRIPAEKAKDIDMLLTNFIGTVPEIELVCVLDLGRETTIAIKPAAGLSDVKIDRIEIMVHQILEGVTKSFDLTSLGTGVFEIGYLLRFIFAKAGPDLLLSVVSNIRIPTEQTLAYSCLAAEKLWRIMDGRSVTLNIPVLDVEKPTGVKQEINQVKYIGVKPGRYLAKLAIVGDEGVGKSSVVRRYIENAFDEDYKATIGVNIMSKLVRFPDMETTMKLSIHDMGGQEQFARVRRAYFRGTHACFIVFDVTNRNSFENVKTWYNQTIEYSGVSTAIILIGNKIDLVEERTIDNDEVADLISELGCYYIETSAKTGENVETAFSLIALFLCGRSEKHVKTEEKLPTMEEFLRDKTLPHEIIEALAKGITERENTD